MTAKEIGEAASATHESCGGALRMTNSILWCQRCGDEDTALKLIRVQVDPKGWTGVYGTAK